MLSFSQTRLSVAGVVLCDGRCGRRVACSSLSRSFGSVQRRSPANQDTVNALTCPASPTTACEGDTGCRHRPARALSRVDRPRFISLALSSLCSCSVLLSRL